MEYKLQLHPPRENNAIEISNGFVKVDQDATYRYVFRHETNASNINGNATLLIYPGAHPSDIIFVQKSLPYTGSPVLVWYDSVIGSWKISNEMVNINMPVGVTFNVMVIKTQ